MRIDILTLFPEMFAPLTESIIGRATKSGKVEIVVTDTIPLRAPENADISKIKVLSVADMVAEVINRVYNYQSISNIYGF